jgi:hypothetical protein
MTKEIESNRLNSKDHARERLVRTDDRESRPVNRDFEVVKLPDGKEFIRTPRTSLKRFGSVSDLPKKPGFVRRWVSSNIPGRIQDLVDLGYKPATDENGVEIAPIRGGTNKQGETFMRYAMEISEEMNKKIERDNKIRAESKQQESLEKMKGNDLGSGSMTYVGHDSQKTINKTI